MFVASMALSFSMVISGVAREAAPAPAGRDTVTSQFYAFVEPPSEEGQVVETLEFRSDGKLERIYDHLGRFRVFEPGTWKNDGKSIVTMIPIDVYDEVGIPVNETRTFVKSGDSLITSSGSARLAFFKVSKDIVTIHGRYDANRPSADGKDTLKSLTLLPNGVAMLSITKDGKGTVTEGGWSIQVDSGTKAMSVHLFRQGKNGKKGDPLFAFQVSGTRLLGTKYDTNKWGTDLAFERFRPRTADGPGRAFR